MESYYHHELVGGFGAFFPAGEDMKEFDISDRALEQEIKEVNHAEAYLTAYKLGASGTYHCLRCGNRLTIHENKSGAVQGTKLNVRLNIAMIYDKTKKRQREIV